MVAAAEAVLDVRNGFPTDLDAARGYYEAFDDLHDAVIAATPANTAPAKEAAGHGKYTDQLACMPQVADWDTYGGEPTTWHAKATAAELWPVPMADGGIQVELHAGGADIEIEIRPDGGVRSVYFHAAASVTDAPFVEHGREEINHDTSEDA